MNDKPRIIKLDDAVAAFGSNGKCCSKCAFRHGSPERSDGYGWIRLMETHHDHGLAFFCHESVPEHPQEVLDERPRFRVCAGRAATAHLDLDRVCRLAHSVPELDPEIETAQSRKL